MRKHKRTDTYTHTLTHKLMHTNTHTQSQTHVNKHTRTLTHTHNTHSQIYTTHSHTSVCTHTHIHIDNPSITAPSPWPRCLENEGQSCKARAIVSYWLCSVGKTPLYSNHWLIVPNCIPYALCILALCSTQPLQMISFIFNAHAWTHNIFLIYSMCRCNFTKIQNEGSFYQTLGHISWKSTPKDYLIT